LAEITVKRDFEGMKIERFIKRIYPDLPMSLIYKLIRKGKVRVNKKQVKHNFTIKGGDIIILHFPPDMLNKEPIEEVNPRYILTEEEIIFENDEFIAINKPPELAVHGGEGHKEDVLLLAIKKYLKFDESDLRFPPTPVHRLDIDTSGILIFAKNYDFLRIFNELQRNQAIHKEYLALVGGEVKKKQFTVESPVIRRDRPEGLSTGKTGKTIVKLISASDKFATESTIFSLLSVVIKTGRTHQIRSHLMQSGLPILGDKLYGDRGINRWAYKKFNLRRQFLHSAIMRFIINGKEYEIKAPLYQDLRQVLSALDMDFSI